MKIINTGSIYNLYPDDLKTFDQLPAKNYVVRFAKMTGFYLEEYSEINIKEKIYGVHMEKINKVLTAFDRFERNLGVILSGDKGIGKSLFAKLLAVEAVKNNIPVIVVDSFVPGIASFLESITQEVMILFDEFDKTFGKSKNSDDSREDAQVSMLSLFDGISQGKKLFVITCNELSGLNTFLVNRPGRFHYHIRFDYPGDSGIEEYLKDKVEEKYWDQIPDVVSFSKKVNLNYDCLRSIAFELNNGTSFKEAIKDLNIINIDNVKYKLVLHFKDTKVIGTCINSLDLFNKTDEFDGYLKLNTGSYIHIKFDISDCEFNDKMGWYVKGENIILNPDNDDDEDDENIKNYIPDYLLLSRIKGKEYHYAV